jgi:diacylglycerol kinase (ATP)
MSEPMPAIPPHVAEETLSPEPPIVILNPASKRGKRLRRWLQRQLKNGRGELVLTDEPRAGERIARDAASAGRAVVAVGGDGTITEVANGILASGQRVPFGIVPAGNGNDYAWHTLDLPRDLNRALEIALTGPLVAMDAGQVNDRYFVNALGVGIDANIAAAAISLKRVPLLRGQALYWASSLRELLFHYSRCPSLAVAHDGEARERRNYAMAAVSIGPTVGGGFRVYPGAVAGDGLFDLCLVW